jgi:hypothetical protein
LNKKPRNTNGLILLGVLGLLLMYFIFAGSDQTVQSAKYYEIVDYFENAQVTDFSLDMKTGALTLTLDQEASEAYREAQAAAAAAAASTANSTSGSSTSSQSAFSTLWGTANETDAQPVTLVYTLADPYLFLKNLEEYVSIRNT